MEVAHIRRLTALLQESAFRLQRDRSELAFVRESDVLGLFERLELSLTGRNSEAVVLSVAAAVVWDVRTQFRGLLVRGGFAALCNDPENGRVTFSSKADVDAWIARLVLAAPTYVMNFVHAEGEQLLVKTRVAREAARSAFETHIEPRLSDLGTLVGSLLPEQRRIVENASARPFVIGSEELKDEYEAAVAALVLSGDADVLRLGQAADAPAQGPTLIKQMAEVPEPTIHKIRIVADLILRARAASETVTN